ncbi:MAG: GNAT family N-acetyltransferase [Oscillospiraceae bacterium]|nr:GNAT family N-acetyltransferase [Oscillospiraceae bacterium]
MSIIKASGSDFEIVKNITVQTIKSIYPHYYPCGAVDFFLSHHNDRNIATDIENGNVYLCYNNDNEAVGTVTIKDNEICRLFVLPDHQGNGYGRELLTFTEKKISENHSRIILDASLPAKAIYLKRGYVSTEFHTIKAENGDYLCYDLMIKQI